MRRLLKKIVHPILNRWYQRKTSRMQQYRNHGIALDVFPAVFHPGIFLSTNIFIDFLKPHDLAGKRVLELGAGSGMISFFCAKQGAIVTATDINENALKGLHLNAEKNRLSITVLASNLFENVSPNNFDLILINPPYYPKNAENEKDQAFFCGENFEYFQQLFAQLSQAKRLPTIWMILSEDCAIATIKEIASTHGFEMDGIYETKKRMEQNYIFSIR